MAKLRPRPSVRPKGRSLSLARSLWLFLRDSIKISRHWPFTCLAFLPARPPRRGAHGWQMADSIREVRPSVRVSECLWLLLLILLLHPNRADVVAA